MKTVPMAAKLFHANRGQTDGRRGMTKLIVVFRNFANAPKMKNRRLLDARACSATENTVDCASEYLSASNQLKIIFTIE
jgi:hypothetical protein